MHDDRSGRLTLHYIRFGAFLTIALIVGGFLAKLLGFVTVQTDAPVDDPTFALTASHFAPFEGVDEAGAAAGQVQPAALEGTLERPLRIAGPLRATMAPIAVLSAEEPGSVEWVRIDDRLGRYEALQRGEVDLIWESLPGFAEAVHRLQVLPLEARVVALVGQSRGADALVGRAASEELRLTAQRTALEAFSPAHFLFLHRLTRTEVTGEVKARVLRDQLTLTGSPKAAVERWNEGDVRVLGGSEPALPLAFTGEGPELFRMDTSVGPERIDEVLIAHPSVLEAAPGALAAVVAGWQAASQRLAKMPLDGFDLLVGEMGLTEEQAERMIEGVAFATPTMSASFFEGQGASRLEAAQGIWMAEGSIRQVLPADRWIDGRFQPVPEAAATAR